MNAWLRWIGVLGRSRTQYATDLLVPRRGASFTNGFAVGAGLPCVHGVCQ